MTYNAVIRAWQALVPPFHGGVTWAVICCACLLANTGNAQTSDEGHETRQEFRALLADSSVVQDHLAAAVLSSEFDKDPGADELFERLIHDAPENTHVVYRTKNHCVLYPKTSFCDLESLSEKLATLDANNGLIHLLSAAHHTRHDKNGDAWHSLDLASRSQHITTYRNQDLELFLDVLDRYPEYISHEGEAGRLVDALGFALAVADASFAGTQLCLTLPGSDQSQHSHEQRVEICLRLAKLLREDTKEILKWKVGAEIERRILEKTDGDPEHLSQLFSDQSRVNNIQLAGTHAFRVLEVDQNADLMDHYIRMLLVDGELAAFTEIANIAGISIKNPPPHCVTSEERAKRDQMIVDRNLITYTLDPVCPDYLTP